MFYDHETGRHALVADSLETWIAAAAEEMAINGALLPPMDYRNRPEHNGLYAGAARVTTRSD